MMNADHGRQSNKPKRKDTNESERSGKLPLFFLSFPTDVKERDRVTLRDRYCRGGSMVHHLLFPGPNSPLTCGVICHPGPEGAYEKITKPTMWVLAEQDDIFKPKDIAALRQGMEGRDVVFEHTIYEGGSFL
jgi:hypothetical protein